uniref:Chitin-binding type-4 domain-containing protein n=2 Tax=Strongyloides papillosus TaxID=174720 RepID=A0A0N5BQC0_STREA
MHGDETLIVNATPKCYDPLNFVEYFYRYDESEIEVIKENVTAELKSVKKPDVLASVTDLCNKEITVIADNVDYYDIENGDFYVEYTYEYSKKKFNKKIPKECDDKDLFDGWTYPCDFGELNPNLDRERSEKRHIQWLWQHINSHEPNRGLPIPLN